VADNNRPQYLTLAEAADLMSVSVKTLRRRIADGTNPAYRCGRRVIRVRLDDLDRVFQRVPAPQR
jgi:excisionase family DNA binding protein